MKKTIQPEGTSTTFYDTKRITRDQQKDDERRSRKMNDVRAKQRGVENR